MHDRLKAALSSLYEIDREVGRGGMASVFLAQDIKHGRRVAIKVLHLELAAAVGPSRFLREIETAAKLTHPHILSLHDSGERDGLLYYVMPYVDGESLRDRLTRVRQLGLEDAVRIAADVADALNYAHDHGVVHRDIKPENILLSGRHVIVADFGIARALERAAGDTLTDTGVTLGTPQYMSPEQASGQHEIDGRSDIYALGCVLYEMLAGEPPYTGPTIQSIVAKHMTADVPSVRMLRSMVPARIDRVIARMLAKSPADRHADAGALLRDLEASDEPTLGSDTSTPATVPRSPVAQRTGMRRPRIPVWSVALGVVAVVGAFVLWRATMGGDAASPSSAPPARVQSLAVLPFENMGGVGESTYFADGITEEIIDAIGRIPGLRVSSRTSAFAFKEKRGLSMQQIADSLKVGAILEGSVRRDGNRLRVIARLVDVAADSQLFARNFNRELRDVFALQNEIAEDIAGALRISLTGSATVVPRAAPTRDVEAYDLYLQGRAYWNQRTPASLREAIGRFERAIARDSSFVAAYVGLSDALMVSAVLGGQSPVPLAARARAVAERALQLDSTSAGAHTALGHALFTFYRDFTGGERHLLRALELDSTYIPARLYAGILYFDRGQLDKAIAMLRRGIQDDPGFSPLLNTVGRAYLCAGEVDSALVFLRRAAAVNPAWSLTYSQLGHALLAKGMSEQALDAFRRGAVLGGAIDSVQLAYAFGMTEQRNAGNAIVRAIVQQKRDVYNLDPVIAMAYLGLGDREAALRRLDRLRDLSGNSLYLRLPAMALLRELPQYKRALRQYGVTQ